MPKYSITEMAACLRSIHHSEKEESLAFFRDPYAFITSKRRREAHALGLEFAEEFSIWRFWRGGVLSGWQWKGFWLGMLIGMVGIGIGVKGLFADTERGLGEVNGIPVQGPIFQEKGFWASLGEAIEEAEEKRRLAKEKEDNLTVEERHVRVLERQVVLQEERLEFEKQRERTRHLSDGGWNSYMGMTNGAVRRIDEAKTRGEEGERERKRVVEREEWEARVREREIKALEEADRLKLLELMERKKRR